MLVDAAAVRAAVDGVPDPELPAVTIGMLGMVHDVRIDADADAVDIDILPTFSGCPATEMIARDVRTAVTAVVGDIEVRVRFLFEPMWTPARIDATGRERLREFGITPPRAEHSRGPVVVPLSPAARGDADRGSWHATGGGSAALVATCPYCGSDETDTDSPFGPTPCRSLHYCRNYRQPFEAFKDL